MECQVCWWVSEARVSVVHGPMGSNGFLSWPGTVVLSQCWFCHRSVSQFVSSDQTG